VIVSPITGTRCIPEVRIELLNTGSELLLGEVRDLHLSWLGRELFPLGLRIARQVTVPDGSAIRDALIEAFPRCDVLIVTGGLGPTTDDITREVVAELLGLKLSLHPKTLSRIQERFRRRGLPFQPRTERQAMVPQWKGNGKGMEVAVLPNDNGTAPGLSIPPLMGVSWVTPHIFLLPGPPRELQPMARAHLFPFLRKLSGVLPGHGCRIYKIVGMGESILESRIGLELSQRGDLEVGYCARPNEVDFRLIGAEDVLEEVEPRVLDAVGDHFLSSKNESMEEVVVSLLRKRGAKLATAESCTGGLLASRVTNVPGASEVFLTGFVTYSNQAKAKLLGVPSELIERHGAVSEEVVRAMAAGAREKTGASHALAITGIAGPGGGSVEKPVGTVWLALSSRDAGTGVPATQAWRENFPTDRLTFKQMATQSALDRLRKLLGRSSP
jgi:nicotinamide-nucleotide amidase